MHVTPFPSTLTPEQVRAFYDAHRTVRLYQTQPDGSPIRMTGDELDAVLHAAQRAPTDATAQLYSFIHLTTPDLLAQVAELTGNPHIKTASEAFVACSDTRRVGKILEAAGHEPGHWPAIAVHFGIGDIVMSGQNLLTAAEMLGYQGCWIGGVVNNMDALITLLGLPEGVLPFAAITVGRPAENAPLRPRLPRELVVHTDAYRDGTPEELRRGTEIMNPIADRPGKPGDWARLLKMYFGQGGGMEAREPGLVAALRRQGLWTDGE